MGFLKRSRGRGDVHGVATIRESDPLATTPDTAPSHVVDVVIDHFGSERYRLLLEIRIPGRDPYMVDGSWKVPNRSLGAFGGGGVLAAGIEVPVRVDSEDPQSVAIDWDAYKAAPGRKQAQKAAQESHRSAQARTQLENNPKLADKLRANNRQAVHGWAAAVRAGSMSREDFERNVQLSVDGGRMDPADAEAARATLDA